MQETIQQIPEGHFDHEDDALEFSCVKIECTLCAGETCEGSFRIMGKPGHVTSGRILTTDPRMECLTEHFEGTESEIRFRFRGESLEDGASVSGDFLIISSQGEFSLPFTATAETKVLSSSAGPIKNLFHFTNLAKSSWEEARTLFYSKDFPGLLTGGDARFADLYRGLAARSGQGRNMEEFLVCTGKKQRPEFLVREAQIRLALSPVGAFGSVAESELTVVRNGWGYTCLRISCEGAFLFTERESLLDEHFLGNQCRLQVFVDPAQCRPGRNSGAVILSDEFTRLAVPVEVLMGEAAPVRLQLRRDRIVAELTQLYQKFRLKKCGSAEWKNRSMSLVEQLEAMDADDPAPRLFRAQLLIAEKRFREAQWALERALQRMDSQERDDTLRAYYLYLTTLLGGEETDAGEAAREVEQIYRSDRTNWRVAWLLLYLSPEYSLTSAGKWEFLERQFAYGCTSPILYLEALQLANANPALVRRLEGASLRILAYGARKEALGPELVEQILYLSGRTKEFSELQLRMLETMYKGQPDPRTLGEICKLLIRANRVGKRYFEWYARGVEAQLRITRLYEYYMMSVDLDSRPELPRAVVLYFSYQNNLDYEHSAYLYAYVLEHRAELAEQYESYRLRLRYFVSEQIIKMHINRNLAQLYGELLEPELVTEQTAPSLARLLFARQITVEDRRFKKVVVVQPELIRPREYPLIGGTTWLALYGDDFTLLFEDADGNRYSDQIAYRLERLMTPEKHLYLLEGWKTNCPELDLYLCSGDRNVSEWTRTELERALRVAGNGAVQPALRRRLSMKVLQFYYEQDRTGELDDWLEHVDGEVLTGRSRALALKFLIYRGQYDKAWDWIVAYGPGETENKPLLRLVCTRIEQTEYARDRALLELALYVFRGGGRDARLLQYLAEHADGRLRELRDIWKAAGEYDADRKALEERMLIRMLWCGSEVAEKSEIFRSYLSDGADGRLVRAFLEQSAYDGFVRGRDMQEPVFREIRKGFQRGEAVSRVCRLAYLKYYGEHPDEIGGEERELLSLFLRELLEEHVHLNMFRNLAGKGLANEYVLREMADKTILEYHAEPGARARIHYCMSRTGAVEADYLTEPMQEVCDGVFFKEFILFFGETVEYYISEEKDGAEQLTESGTLQRSDSAGGEDDWRYGRINGIVTERALGDDGKTDELLEEYERRAYLNGELFTLR